MYKELFIKATNHLSKKGLLPEIGEINPLSEKEIKRIEKNFGFKIPNELIEFYTELGDNFYFKPDENHTGFQPSSVYDLHDSNIFYEAYVEDVEHEISQNPSVDHSLLIAESERRKRWFPFYGIGGGGYLLCLDLTKDPAPVCYYERICWVSQEPEFWNFELAPSFKDFITEWSNYSFSDPGCEIVSYCMDKVGKFDWSNSTKIFDPKYQI